MAKMGEEVPLTELKVPPGKERFCADCGAVAGRQTAQSGFVGFVTLEKGAGAWAEKLYCGDHLPTEAKVHHERFGYGAMKSRER